MSYALIHNIGAFISSALARIPETITAAAGNDNVEISGPYTSRKRNGRVRNSVKVSIPFSATLQATETLTVAANIQDADDVGGTGVADFGGAASAPGGGAEIFASAVVATGPGGGGTVNGVVEFDVDLTGAREFIRLQSTANLSASGTDTVDIAGIFIFGPDDELP